MKKALTIILAVVAAAVLLPAAQLNCNEVANLGQLVTAGTGGNYVSNGDTCLDQDKLYSNFYYNPGTDNPLPANVGVDIHTTPNPTGQEYHYVILTSPSDAWFGAVSFGYRIDVVAVQGEPERYISKVDFDILGSADSGSKTLSNGWSAVIPEESSASVNSQGFNVSVAATSPIGSAGITGFHDIYTQDIVPQIPEPGTYALFGGGLLALGILRRRRK